MQRSLLQRAFRFVKLKLSRLLLAAGILSRRCTNLASGCLLLGTQISRKLELCAAAGAPMWRTMPVHGMHANACEYTAYLSSTQLRWYWLPAHPQVDMIDTI
eukprot:SAG31_NODE_9423_length_1278_cov_4.667515_2_plen_102_part_00